MSQKEAIFLLCGYPVLMAIICSIVGWFWCLLRTNARESDTRRYPRPGTHPERPAGFRPFRKHPDMLDDTSLNER
jgi:hypothetical protein